jgi:hypothetical protein
MNSQLLSAVLITGLVLSAGSVYLNHIVFADDPWSSIAARQQISEDRAMAKYMSYYQFANMDQSKRNWSGLTNTETDETSRGRNIDAQTQVSLQNAIAAFDNIHVTQLADLASDNYKGISSTPTDTQGRDRNVMLAAATATSLTNADDILSQLRIIQQNYVDFTQGAQTDTTATYDRQTLILQNMDSHEALAADLVSQLAKINGVYIDLSQYVNTSVPYIYKQGSVTNEMTHGGRDLNLPTQQSLEKAIAIFNEIHHTHIAYLYHSYYGLTNTPTDTQGRDRNAMLEQAKDVSMTNALRVYNSYYNGVGLK